MLNAVIIDLCFLLAKAHVDAGYLAVGGNYKKIDGICAKCRLSKPCANTKAKISLDVGLKQPITLGSYGALLV